MAMSNDPTASTSNDAVSQEVLGHQTLLRLMPELMAIPSQDLQQVLLDVPAAVATVLGSLPEIRALRPQIAETIKGFDLESFDKLEDYALALRDAHTEFLTATKPMDDLDAMVEEGTKLRDRLDADAKALVLHNLVDNKKLAEVQGGVGYLNLANDLSIYAKVFRHAWAQIENKVATSASDVERADKLGQRISRVIGLREQATQAVAEATDVRTRIYTRLLQVYDKVRRAVGYLRWEDQDADSIAPSLFAGRQRRKGAAAQPANTDLTNPPPGTVAPVKPQPTPATQASPASPARTAGEAEPTATPKDGPLPGGDPFLS